MDVPRSFSYNDITVDVEKLWDTVANTETSQVSIDSLLHYLKRKLWGESVLSPYELYKTKDLTKLTSEEADHLYQIENADLSYPIILWDTGSKTLIIDGVHRILKALGQGQRDIKSVYATNSDLGLQVSKV